MHFWFYTTVASSVASFAQLLCNYILNLPCQRELSLQWNYSDREIRFNYLQIHVIIVSIIHRINSKAIIYKIKLEADLCQS